MAQRQFEGYLTLDEIESIKNKEFSLKLIDDKCKEYVQNKGIQIRFIGQPMGTAKSREEIDCLHRKIYEILMYSTHPFLDLEKLRLRISDGNMSVLLEEYYELNYSAGTYNDFFIIKSTNEPFIHLNAFDAFQTIDYYRMGKSTEEIIQIMLFDSFPKAKSDKATEKDFYRFEKYYFNGKLNNSLKWICEKSCQGNGFAVYSVNEWILSKDYSMYIFDVENNTIGMR